MLLSLNGLIALRNGLISFSLVKEHCRGCERSHHLSAMISNNGIKFLLNGKATPNQLLEFNIQNLRELLSDNGLIAFDEELISLEQFKKMDIWNLRNALKPDVLNAAREEQQASRMLNIGY